MKLKAYRSYYQAVYRTDHPSQYGGTNSCQWCEWVDSSRRTLLTWFERLGFGDRLALVLELGCGGGYLRDVHQGWLGLELSLSALQRVLSQTPMQPNRLLNADMQVLPLKGGSIDLLFSWAAIEHVPNPELVMAEIQRVLKPGGIAILAPSWNCRSWTAKRLQFRSYRELCWVDRFAKMIIPIRNSLLWRGFCALPGRVKRELVAFFFGELKFDYRRLFPVFSLEAVHISDDDAQASMDAHAAIMYFKSRGWSVLSHPTFTSRFFVRHEPVVVRKPHFKSEK